MGNTYRKERTFDDHGSGHRFKKLVNHTVDKKQSKNKNHYFEEFEESEDFFEDEKNNTLQKIKSGVL